MNVNCLSKGGADDDVEDVQTQMMAVIGENNNFHRTIMVIVIVVSSAPPVQNNNNNPYTSEEQRRDIVRNRRSFVQYIMAPTIPISRVEHAYEPYSSAMYCCCWSFCPSFQVQETSIRFATSSAFPLLLFRDCIEFYRIVCFCIQNTVLLFSLKSSIKLRSCVRKFVCHPPALLRV